MQSSGESGTGPSPAPMSFAAMATSERKEATVKLQSVQMDGLVLLRIARHCRESAPTLVTGQLLGLDVDSTLEVSGSFPFPNTASRSGTGTADGATAGADMTGADLEELVANEGAAHQLEVLRCLREIGVDANTVGWYQSTLLDSFQTRELVETFIAYHENIKRCVCIIYDPMCTTKGNAGFKALRLSEKFLELYKNGSITVEALDSSLLSWNDIFDEIPISVKNSVLVETLMADLQYDTPISTTKDDYDRLDVATTPFLVKNLDYMIECLDDYQREQTNLAQHQRNILRNESQRAAWIAKRRAENAARRAQGEELLPEEDPTHPLFKAIAEPDRLDVMLINSQIGN